MIVREEEKNAGAHSRIHTSGINPRCSFARLRWRTVVIARNDSRGNDQIGNSNSITAD